MSASAVLVTSERLNRGRWCQPIPISLAFSPHKWVCLIHISLLRRLCKRQLSYAIYLFSWIMNAQTSIQGDNYTCLKLSRLKEKFHFGLSWAKTALFFWSQQEVLNKCHPVQTKIRETYENSLSLLYPPLRRKDSFFRLRRFVFPATRSVSLCRYTEMDFIVNASLGGISAWPCLVVAQQNRSTF